MCSSTSLSVKRPTSTTVLYTISSRAATTRYSVLWLQRLLVGFSRILIASSLVAVIYIKLRSTPMAAARLPSPVWLQGTAVETVASHAPWRYLLPLATASLYLCLLRAFTEESLLVIRGLGVQTSSSSGTYLSSASTRFIPTSVIQDIFLHEAFKGFEVKFYLSIVVENEDDLVVVFPKTFPRRQSLEEVWRGTKACLYEPKAT